MNKAVKRAKGAKNRMSLCEASSKEKRGNLKGFRRPGYLKMALKDLVVILTCLANSPDTSGAAGSRQNASGARIPR